MDDSEMGALLAVLRRLQEEGYLSARGLAKRLGFSPSHLSMLYAGKRQPGLRFLQAVMRRYPEMPGLVRQELEARQARAAGAKSSQSPSESLRRR